LLGFLTLEVVWYSRAGVWPCWSYSQWKWHSTSLSQQYRWGVPDGHPPRVSQRVSCGLDQWRGSTIPSVCRRRVWLGLLLYTPHPEGSGTANCDLYVRAIKLEMGPSGQVEMLYKGSPSNANWGGLSEIDDMYPTAKGFVLLVTLPEGSPEVVVSRVAHTVIQKVQHDLKHAKLQTAEACSLGDSLQWLEQAICGPIPTNGLTQNSVVSKCANFGVVESVGVPPRLYDLPIIRPVKKTPSQMFELPRDNLDEIRQRNERLDNAQASDRNARGFFPPPFQKKMISECSWSDSAWQAALFDDSVFFDWGEGRKERRENWLWRIRGQRESVNVKWEHLPRYIRIAFGLAIIKVKEEKRK